MHFAKTYSAQTSLLAAHIVEIEVDITKKTLHAFSVVGLPDKSVEESKDRVSAAIKNSGFDSPKKANQKIIVSLAPAHLKKEGALFDVGIALTYLKAIGDITFDEEKKLFIGELSLQGDIRPVAGILAIAESAKKHGFTELFVPTENAKEAALISGITAFPCNTLLQIIQHIDSSKLKHKQIAPQIKTKIAYTKPKECVSFEDIRGQSIAKRALLIAASGGHNIALYGPPGTGKTMLAKAFQAILPPLTESEILEATTIHSIAGQLKSTLITHPPLRMPHNSASHVAILGGGPVPKPGEVTLAHRGVLFLDEFPEFERRVIDGLRQPLEDQEVHIARAQMSAVFPADFILIAAMNPCPCGNYGSEKECVCMPAMRQRYQKKISGPIMDRIDMWIEVPRIDPTLLAQKKKSDVTTKDIQVKVREARNIQFRRFGAQRVNSRLTVKDLDTYIILEGSAEKLLQTATQKMTLSPRVYHKIIKLARTIADLDGAEHIKDAHILEALQYRPTRET